MRLVSLLIGGTFGPMCFTDAKGVNAMFLKYVRMGLFFPACPPVGFPMQDVRDAALMHSLAMVSPKPTANYLVPQRLVRFYGSATFSEVTSGRNGSCCRCSKCRRFSLSGCLPSSGLCWVWTNRYRDACGATPSTSI